MSVQKTLTGDTTEKGRVRPETLLYCEECGEAVLRSRRFDHEHELDTDKPAYEKALEDELQEKIPDHANIETQSWVVEFHDTHIERVTVEASHKAEAKNVAEEVRTYDGELMETGIHVDRRPIGEASMASIEYLEDRGLLPEDHDITQTDLQRAFEAGETDE
jgi:hypothetical protein